MYIVCAEIAKGRRVNALFPIGPIAIDKRATRDSNNSRPLAAIMNFSCLTSSHRDAISSL